MREFVVGKDEIKSSILPIQMFCKIHYNQFLKTIPKMSFFFLSPKQELYNQLKVVVTRVYGRISFYLSAFVEMSKQLTPSPNLPVSSPQRPKLQRTVTIPGRLETKCIMTAQTHSRSHSPEQEAAKTITTWRVRRNLFNEKMQKQTS